MPTALPTVMLSFQSALLMAILSTALGCGGSVCEGFVMPNTVASQLPNPASYDISVAGVVTDNVTGLMWERRADIFNLYNQAAAAAHCVANRTNGYADWRLPTVIELASLSEPELRYPGPAIDVAAFPFTPTGFFWSSQPAVGKPGYGWYVNFGGFSTNFDLVTKPYYARCVR